MGREQRWRVLVSEGYFQSSMLFLEKHIIHLDQGQKKSRALIWGSLFRAAGALPEGLFLLSVPWAIATCHVMFSYLWVSVSLGFILVLD